MSTRSAPPSGAETRSKLADRYGAARKTPWASRRRKWVFGLLGLLVGALAAYLGYHNLGSDPIEAQTLGFEEKPDNSMTVKLNVTRDDPGKAGVCIVNTRDRSGAESGRREVLVPPASDSLVVTPTIRSNGRPVTADVFGCSYDVPPYLSTPKRPTG